LKAAIEDNIALARYLAERIRTTPNLELVASGLSVVCFRYVPPDGRVEEEVVRLNRAILDRLQLSGDAFITSTELRGRFVLRACIVNYRSTRDDIDRLIAAVRSIGGTMR
jgi:glutamate/tyrosine decarboxylase-like PLP-dependent enzyme